MIIFRYRELNCVLKAVCNLWK